MHTSTVLRSSDFHYCRLAQGNRVPADFHTFCPQYHVLDRIGVVSPYLEDGVCSTSYALLALTTAFYDVLRARSETFFDYPHHFALLDANAVGVQTHTGRLPLDRTTMGAPWGGLDVWPESNWITAPGTVTGMLQTVFERQITRLFWPEDFTPTRQETPLPTYVLALLKARLTTVYYYNTPAPTLAVYVTKAVEDLVQRSIARLPQALSPSMLSAAPQQGAASAPDSFPYVGQYRQVRGETFLAAMSSCFAVPEAP